MSLDLLAIADGLAARYAAAAVTPPTGLRNIAQSTARLENENIALPMVAVFPPQVGAGELTYQPGRRLGEWDFIVRLYLEESAGDLSKHIVQLYKWLAVVIDQTHAVSQLGVTGVTKTLPATVGIGEMDYAGTTYDGIELHVTVWTEDNVTLTP